MFFKNRKNKSEQRGTLMVEAIAMLGLIAIVTPTLYKKSAERLQEIQDINIASQARTMSQIIEAYVRNHTTSFRDLTPDGSTTVIEICREDNCADMANKPAVYLKEGYSSAIPYGFRPDELKNFGNPRVFAVAEDGSVVFYVVYPALGKEGTIGKKRTARLASLIGANGGFVEHASSHILGTGGAWELDSTMIDEFKLPKDLFVENSIVVTNNEPIMTTMDDTDVYLYRIPPSTIEEFYHNTMVTDLYLGGNQETSSKNAEESKEYHSIFNVRKMTLNTRCSASYIYGATASTDSAYCDPDVADLYVGKPFGRFREDPQKAVGVEGAGTKNFEANTGAAWIYGNFAALSDRFKVFHTAYNSTATSYDREGFDVMRFSRLSNTTDVWNGDDSSTSLDLAVLTASNEDKNAYVSMVNGLVRVVEDSRWLSSEAVPAFLVGGSTGTNDISAGRLIAAFNSGAGGVVHINSLHDSKGVTRINDYGGTVYINGSSSDVVDQQADTYINEGGGNLFAGRDGDWIKAGGIDGSTHVDILQAGSSGTGDNARRFSVGGETFDDHMIFASSKVTSLRDGAIRAYKATPTVGNVGGVGMFADAIYGTANTPTTLENGAVIAAKYTDILGPTYIGYKNQMSSKIDGNENSFVRDNWALGVAGSAWVDDLLFANDAWFNRSGFKELHAGFSTFAEYNKTPRNGWLNAYDDGIVVNNRKMAGDGGSSGVGGVHAEYTRFFADESRVYMGDSKGAMAHLEDGVAKFGYTDSFSSGLPEPINFVGADDTRAFVEGDKLVELYTSSDVIGSSDAVDIQKGAMLFKGHSWENGGRATHAYDKNEIEAHAGRFTLQTAKVIGQDADGNKIEGVGPEAAMLYADGKQIRTRFVDFQVQSNSSENIFHVRPNMVASSTTDSANVTVNGSFYVTGNDVFHAATDNSNTAAGAVGNNPHATFEIDPQFVRVMARRSAAQSSFIEQEGNTLAMFEVNSYDVDGTSSAIANAGEDPTKRASVYVRRGAIELEKSTAGDSLAADEGYGYIKANRFVSNTGKGVPVAPAQTSDGAYDQYMVNPAYTSVMHDIKLTTRGGARLSDILPDYVLKGVYNVSNDFIEGSQDKSNQLCWSSGRTSNCKNVKIAWADPYVGRLPYAICPPGYKNLATLVPTSFQMAQAGDMVKSTAFASGGGRSKAFVINPAGSRQANILSVAKTTGEIAYPNLVKSISLEHNETYKGDGTHKTEDLYQKRTEGWFFGYDALRVNDTNPLADTVSKLETIGASEDNPEKRSAYKYSPGMDVANRTTGFVPEPLYFQQNTYLKTALEPLSYDKGGWEARMGFLYDMDNYSGYDEKGLGNAGIMSQNNDGTGNDGAAIPFQQPGTWVWNLFPVPTNTLEGHATVYCYFDRTKFTKSNWSSLVDNIDQLNDYRNPTDVSKVKSGDYRDRLNDPSLKYSDPW